MTSPVSTSPGLKPIYILNGPNLNRLGAREPHRYGATTLAAIEAACVARAGGHGFDSVFRQSNHEGALVDWLHEAGDKASAIVLNAGAYTHTSLAILDAIKAIPTPVIECHLSNPAQREAFRQISYVAMGARGGVFGLGVDSYLLAVDAACQLVRAGQA
jgi:3-dehydroquinate dehydratase-2